MINFEIVIVLYIITSFLLFYYLIDNKKEGACTSKQFYINNKKNAKNKYGANLSSPAGSDEIVTANNMINSFVSIMDEIENDMTEIKQKIPINFNLGVANNVDDEPSMEIYGSLPKVFINFSIQNPPGGTKGFKGENAPPLGPTGPQGPKGENGLDGYWGTTKDNLF
jgi:hypothetical protein